MKYNLSINNKLYSIADKIRTNLLLFVDKEITSSKSKNFDTYKLSPLTFRKENQYFINIEMSFSNYATETITKGKSAKNQINYFLIDNSEKLSHKINHTDNSYSTNQSYNTSKYINNASKKLKKKSILERSLKLRLTEDAKSIISDIPIYTEREEKRKSLFSKKESLNGSFFQRKRRTKISKTVKMIKKPKNGKNYLKYLCLKYKKPFFEINQTRMNSCKNLFDKNNNINSGRNYKDNKEDKEEEINHLTNIEKYHGRKKKIKFSFKIRRQKENEFTEFIKKRTILKNKNKE